MVFVKFFFSILYDKSSGNQPKISIRGLIIVILYKYYALLSGQTQYEGHLTEKEECGTVGQSDRHADSNRDKRTGRLSSSPVLKGVVLWFIRMCCDGQSTQRCYLGGLWGKRPCFGSADLLTRKARPLRSTAFVVQHAKHTKWTSFNSLTPPIGKVEFMSLHLSGMVSFYSASGYGFKVCVLAVAALTSLLVG